MHRFTSILSILLITGVVSGTETAHADRRLPVERERSWTHEARFTATGQRLLIVDNICGSVTVRGHDGKTRDRDIVEIRVDETIRARTEADADRAATEAELAIDARPDTVTLIADGPFRRKDGGIQWYQRRYAVCYDIQITAPRRIDTDLRTVNSGTVDIADLDGDFLASNVNGPVVLDRVTGSGELSSVNGDVELRVRALPNGGWSIETVNGDIDAWFPPRLGADLRFQTRNGAMLTDFEHELREAETVKVERTDQGVFRLERPRGAWSRVGGGGAEISIETLNGDIRLRRSTGSTP